MEYSKKKKKKSASFICLQCIEIKSHTAGKTLSIKASLGDVSKLKGRFGLVRSK